MQVANVNVPVRITGRHLQLTEPIRTYVETKIDGLHLDYPRIIEAHAILEVEKYRHCCEIVLHCANHITIEAADETADMYSAIDSAVKSTTSRITSSSSRKTLRKGKIPSRRSSKRNAIP